MSLTHHSLVAWQRADDLFVTLHRLSLKAFPSFERFELGQQLRRAAFSVPVNIAEGFARPGGRARLNFLNISQASLAEVDYCIHVARRLGYISEELAESLQVAMKRVGAPLAGLIRSERGKTTARQVSAVVLFALLVLRFS
ncbi:MAG TPA: four helix bundle protein [Vicinamibacterales bacterium]|nr:four helix bundle protein [Vicinamibacterales bacterium]